MAVREELTIVEQTEKARLVVLRNAWAAGKASGDGGPTDFAGIKAEGRARLKATPDRRRPGEIDLLGD